MIDFPQGNFTLTEVFKINDSWIDVQGAWLEYGDNVVRALERIERARYNLSASCGQIVAIRVARWLVSTEYNEVLYDRLDLPQPTNPSQHEYGHAIDFSAFRFDTWQLVPHYTVARHAEAAGFRRVAVIKNKIGHPIGVHADLKDGPQVASGYAAVYPGAQQEEWY